MLQELSDYSEGQVWIMVSWKEKRQKREQEKDKYCMVSFTFGI